MISQEQAIDYLQESGWLQEHDRALTEDAVPVVRCKDCKHAARERLGYSCEMNYRLATNGNFYCADGERKENV